MVSRSAAAVLPLVCCLLAVPAPARAGSGAGVTVSTCPGIRPLTLGEADFCGNDVLDALFTGLVEYDPRRAFRMGWQLDFPHIQNVLGPQFASGGVYNYGLYRNPKYDALLRAADRQVSRTKAIGLYRRAEVMVVRDMPAIPLWFYRHEAGYSRRIAPPRLTPFGWLDPVSVRPA